MHDHVPRSTLGPGRAPARLAALAPVLERLATEFEVAVRLPRDPVAFVWRYDDPADREIVAFCAAGLAFGRVASIMASVQGVLDLLGPRPADAVRRLDVSHVRAALSPIVHRWIRGDDLAALLLVLQALLREWGSLEAAFLAGHAQEAPDVGPALDAFSRRARRVDVRAAYGGRRPSRAGVDYFFPSPANGAACKRLNLFLRWMVRRGRIDPGGWMGVAPSQLVVPLDTHVVRVARCLRLTARRTPGWAMASEITDALRQLAPDDPVGFDFALCHVGMLGQCGDGTPRGAESCPLSPACRPRVGRRRASPRPSVPR
jgi:uncharacterized protein (TIGR02757 family)